MPRDLEQDFVDSSISVFILSDLFVKPDGMVNAIDVFVKVEDEKDCHSLIFF